jgi:ketosteroid isomerase-like protein
MIHRQEIEAWLITWQRFINETAYESARPLFAEEVVAFGTVTGYMRGLAELESRQWRQVWYRIKDFAFETESLTLFGEPSSDIVTVACVWHSLGQALDGWYMRRGRVTLVLRKTGSALQCIHSHFSMEPGIPAVAGGAAS